MKKTLYLMRHGQTLFNKRRKVQGWCDSPLTELGIKQAEAAAKYFKERNIVFDHAYCSTSERARNITGSVTFWFSSERPTSSARNTKSLSMLTTVPSWKRIARRTSPLPFSSVGIESGTSLLSTLSTRTESAAISVRRKISWLPRSPRPHVASELTPSTSVSSCLSGWQHWDKETQRHA